MRTSGVHALIPLRRSCSWPAPDLLLLLRRDIKPSNMLVAENRYVKLGDLGLCKKLGEEGRAYTHVGTPGGLGACSDGSVGKGGRGAATGGCA